MDKVLYDAVDPSRGRAILHRRSKIISTSTTGGGRNQADGRRVSISLVMISRWEQREAREATNSRRRRLRLLVIIMRGKIVNATKVCSGSRCC